MLFGKTVCGKRVIEKGAFGMRYRVLFEHLPSLLLGAAGLSDLQRVVIAAACHVLLADPAIDQRFQSFYQVDATAVRAEGSVRGFRLQSWTGCW